MNTVKYILFCIIDCFDAYTGKGSNGGIKEAIIGITSLLFIILLYLASFFILNRKTKLTHKQSILFAALITLLFVGVVFSIIIIIELIVT